MSQFLKFTNLQIYLHPICFSSCYVFVSVYHLFTDLFYFQSCHFFTLFFLLLLLLPALTDGNDKVVEYLQITLRTQVFLCSQM